MNDWTVMVYLAGENNLAEEMVYALKSMQLVGSKPGDYEVVALYDGSFGPVTIEIPQSNFAPLDVTNLHEISEKARAKETAEAIKQLETMIEKVREVKAEIEKEARAAGILENSDLLPDSGDSSGKLPAQIDSAQTSEWSYSALDELLKLSNGKEDNLNKKDARSAVPVAVPVLTASARAFLKEALANNAIKILEDYEIASAIEEELSDEIEALANGRQVARTVRNLLADFAIQTIKTHKAHHYMLVLSGHGSGAVGDFLPGNGNFSSLTIAELKDALSEVSSEISKDDEYKDQKFKIDILGFDSCLMGMAEVAYQVRDFAKFLIGSEGFEPNTGWPYDVVLNGLKTASGRELKGLPERIVRSYVNYYSSDFTLADVSTHLCAMDLSKIGNFTYNFAELAKQLYEELEKERRIAEEADADLPAYRDKGRSPRPIRDAVVLAHWEAQGFKLEQHVDVWDFCDRLKQRVPAPSISNACDKVKESIMDEKNSENSLVLFSDYCGPTFQYARGLSIFFPWANNTDSVGTMEMEHYAGSLDFARATGWHSFVMEYHAATQREPRPGPGDTFDSTLNRQTGLFTGPPLKFGLPNASRFGLPNASRFGLPNASRFGLPNASRFGLPNASRFGLPSASRFGLPNASRFGLPNASRFGVTGGLAKIESMKNPPTRWRKQQDGGEK